MFMCIFMCFCLWRITTAVNFNVSFLQIAGTTINNDTFLDEETEVPNSVSSSLISGNLDSTCEGSGLPDNSKPYVMFWASDAASATIDFSKGDVEDGVVDSHSINDLKIP